MRIWEDFWHSLRWGLFLACALVGLGTVGCGRDSGNKRLAIVGFAGMEAGADLTEQNVRLIDLLTAQLTTNAGIELVERSAIDTLLKEQSLSLAQASTLAQSVQVGKILRADWLLMGLVLTNQSGKTLLAKIVDANTSVIRNVSFLVIDQGGLPPLADALAGLVLESQPSKPGSIRKSFLAIGSFENVSLIRRDSDFGDSLRIKLSSRNPDARVAVVERSMIQPILDELRWGLVNQSESSENAISSQPAFILVDGIFQAFQDETSKINVILRVERPGMSVQRFAFNEPLGEALHAKIEATLRAIIDEPLTKPVSRLEEARVQLERGFEVARIEKRGGRFQMPQMIPVPSAYDEIRKANLLEGMKAFQSALFLDPSNEEAKLCLGLCHSDPQINQVTEGMSYLQEIIGSSTNRSLVLQARERMAAFYAEKDPQRFRAIYETLFQEAGMAGEKVRYARVLDPIYKADYERGAMTREALLHWMVKCWRNDIQAGVEHRTIKGQPLISVYTLFREGMFQFNRVYPGDTAGLKAFMDTLLPQVELDHPQLKPFLASGYLHLFDSNVPPDVLEKYVQSLQWCDENPDQIASPKEYFTDSLDSDIGSHFFRGRHDLFLLASGVMDRHGQTYANQKAQDYRQFLTGWVHRQRGDLKKAVEAFEQIGSREVHVGIGGPWGPLGNYNGKILAQQCQLLASGQRPILAGPPTEILAGAELSFDTTQSIACDGPRLWVVTESELYEYFQNTLKPVSVTVSNRPIRKFHTVVAGENHLWLGTQGNGLIALDKQTRKARQYTMQQGLLQDHIEVLYPMPDKVWIGFGNRTVNFSLGGLGYLDLSADRFVGIMGQLDTNLTARPLTGAQSRRLVSSNAPPRYAVEGFMQREQDHILVVDSGRIYRYDIASKDWNVAHGIQPFGSFAANERFMIGSSFSSQVPDPDKGTGFGAVSIHDQTSGKWKAINRTEGLPNNRVRSVVIDGNKAWAGGQGFLARIDLESASVEKIYKLNDADYTVRQLAFNGNDLWIVASANMNTISAMRIMPGSNESRIYRLALDPL